MATPNTFKQARVFAAFSFLRQAALGTPIPTAAITSRLPLPLDGRPIPGRRVTRDETRDCSGRYLVGRRLTSRLALWSIQFDATAELVAWLLALALGDAAEPTGAGPSVHAITRTQSDELPRTTIIIGAEEGGQPAEIYRDLTLNTLDVEGEIRGKVRARAGFIGSADVDVAADFDAPACGAVVPVYANDCRLQIGGTGYTDNLRSFAYRFNNNLLAGDDPFPFDAVDLVRLERGVETSLFQFGVYGTKAHPLYIAGEAESSSSVALRIGTAAEGTEIQAPSAQLTLGDTPITYAGEANRSVISLDATPLAVGSAMPDNVVATLAHADRFLTVPA